MTSKKIYIYTSSLFAWSFLSLACYKLSLLYFTSTAWNILTFILPYFFYLFYLWFRIKSRPKYIEYLILSTFYLALYLGFRFLYFSIILRGHDFEFADFDITVFLGLLGVIVISSTAFYWLTRLSILIFKK
jgi:hypothetical protein